MQPSYIRFPAIGALALLPACGPSIETRTVGGAQPELVRDAAPMSTGDATIVARWEQTVVGGGTVETFLYAPGEPQAACHLTTRAAGMDFHCENHAGEIVVTGLDAARPHTVAVSIDRLSGTAALRVTQDGSAAAQDRQNIPGAPDLAAGERLRVQFSVRGAQDTTVELGRFEVAEVN